MGRAGGMNDMCLILMMCGQKSLIFIRILETISMRLRSGFSMWTEMVKSICFSGREQRCVSLKAMEMDPSTARRIIACGRRPMVAIGTPDEIYSF